MAKAGFFFLPDEADSDSVRCPFCLKNLTGWEENDDPMLVLRLNFYFSWWYDPNINLLCNHKFK